MGGRSVIWRLGSVPVLGRPLLVFVLLGLLLGLAAGRAVVGPVGLGAVRQQGETKVSGRAGGSGLPALTVLATVAQVIANIGQGVMGPRGLQSRRQVGTGAEGVRASRRPRGGQEGLAAIGHTQFPIEGRLGSLGEVRYPGFLVGQGVNEIRWLWPFLPRKGDDFTGSTGATRRHQAQGDPVPVRYPLATRGRPDPGSGLGSQSLPAGWPSLQAQEPHGGRRTGCQKGSSGSQGRPTPHLRFTPSQSAAT